MVDDSRQVAAGAKATNTKRAYRGDWDRFVAWCIDVGTDYLPASSQTVAAYLVRLAREGRRVSTVERAAAAISQAHQMAGEVPPTSSVVVRETMKGLRREVGTAQSQKAPVMAEHLRRMVEHLPWTPLGLRDRALLLLGWSGAFRRSEIVALNVEDIEESPEGMVVTVRRSKTDQDGNGRRVGIPFGEQLCPVRAVRSWLISAGISSGPIFRPISRGGRVLDRRISDKTVARAVKGAAEAAGYDAKKYAGHSLRSGFATEAGRAGKSERSIMRQTGHRSERQVRRYIQDGRLFEDCAAVGLL
jgi:site-specific recombinase XerD